MQKPETRADREQREKMRERRHRISQRVLALIMAGTTVAIAMTGAVHDP